MISTSAIIISGSDIIPKKINNQTDFNKLKNDHTYSDEATKKNKPKDINSSKVKSALKSSGMGRLASMFGSLLGNSNNSDVIKQFKHMILHIINNHVLSDHQKLIIIKNTLSK